MKIKAETQLNLKLKKLDEDLEKDHQSLIKAKKELENRIQELKSSVPDVVTEESLSQFTNHQAEKAIIEKKLDGLEVLWEKRLDRYDREQKEILKRLRRVKQLKRIVVNTLKFLKTDRPLELNAKEYKRLQEISQSLDIWEMIKKWINAWNSCIEAKNNIINNL